MVVKYIQYANINSRWNVGMVPLNWNSVQRFIRHTLQMCIWMLCDHNLKLTPLLNHIQSSISNVKRYKFLFGAIPRLAQSPIWVRTFCHRSFCRDRNSVRLEKGKCQYFETCNKVSYANRSCLGNKRYFS